MKYTLLLTVLFVVAGGCDSLVKNPATTQPSTQPKAVTQSRTVDIGPVLAKLCSNRDFARDPLLEIVNRRDDMAKGKQTKHVSDANLVVLEEIWRLKVAPVLMPALDRSGISKEEFLAALPKVDLEKINARIPAGAGQRSYYVDKSTSMLFLRHTSEFIHHFLSEQLAREKRPSEIRWGDPVGNVQVGLELDGRSFEDKVPMRFTCHVRNLGSDRSPVVKYTSGALLLFSQPEGIPLVPSRKIDALLKHPRSNPRELPSGSHTSWVTTLVYGPWMFGCKKRGYVKWPSSGKYKALFRIITTDKKSVDSGPIEIEIKDAQTPSGSKTFKQAR